MKNLIIASMLVFRLIGCHEEEADCDEAVVAEEEAAEEEAKNEEYKKN